MVELLFGKTVCNELWVHSLWFVNVDGLAQDYVNFSVLTMELM